MLSKYSGSTVQVDHWSTESALLVIDTDDYDSLGFPSQTVLFATVTGTLDDQVMAVSDGESFWMGTVNIFDCANVIITNHLGASVLLPAENLIFLKLHKAMNYAMN